MEEDQNIYEEGLNPTEMEMEEEINDNIKKYFEKAYLEPNPIEAFKEVIELERSISKSVKFRFKSYAELAIIYMNNNNEEEFKNSMNNMALLYKKVEDSDKNEAKNKLCFNLDNLPNKERQIKLYEIIKGIFLENNLLNENFEYGLIICNKVLTNKTYVEYNKLIPSLIEDIEDHKENHIAKELEKKIAEIEKQISEGDKQEEKDFEENYYDKDEYINKNKKKKENGLEEIQEDIYKYASFVIEFNDRIENLFEFNKKKCFTDVVTNKIKYNNNSRINQNFLNILIVTENSLIAN